MIDLIDSQVLTEKTNKLLQQNVYVFNVKKDLDKSDVKSIIEQLFNVKVLSVNTYVMSGKKRRLGKFEGYKNVYKRVFVKLSSENVIPFFSGL
uniref:Large ribosomal subunit protein uL23c n=1 Tax=Euglena anabaena TaxID=38273 RepID=A0A0G3F6Y5_EUGAN|nr:ribosomal protein L23 [Euglenaria anabaena]AKJ83366.1 ribosomal protein L23 [Euglenaria anabaena]